MTDTEFDILDELYFVISFDDLQKQLDMDKSELVNNLSQIFKKGWLRIFNTPDGTADIPFVDHTISSAYLLASKAGLKAHNS